MGEWADYWHGDEGVPVVAVLATAVCTNCRGKIKQMTGDLSRRAEWFHDEGGARYCPGAPMAVPVDDSVRQAEEPKSPEPVDGFEWVRARDCRERFGPHKTRDLWLIDGRPGDKVIDGQRWVAVPNGYEEMGRESYLRR